MIDHFLVVELKIRQLCWSVQFVRLSVCMFVCLSVCVQFPGHSFDRIATILYQFNPWGNPTKPVNNSKVKVKGQGQEKSWKIGKIPIFNMGRNFKKS